MSLDKGAAEYLGLDKGASQSVGSSLLTLSVNSAECLAECSQPAVTGLFLAPINSTECLAQCSQPNVTVVGAPVITITTPVDYTTRKINGSNQGVFTLAGTYTGTPTSIEYRYNGGAWATHIASPSGGTYSGSVTLNGPAQGTLEVRFSNNHGTTASRAYITVCEVYACTIDSICSGRATNLQSYTHATLKATQYNTVDGWIDGSDAAWSAKSGQPNVGSYWPHFAQRYMARTGLPVAFINLGVGGSRVSDKTSTLGGLPAIISASAAGGITACLSNGGANDLSLVDLTQPQFNSYVDSYAGLWNSTYNAPTYFDVLGKVTSPGTAIEHANVQKAVLEAVADNANVFLGAVLYDIDNDGIHYKTDSAHETIGRRIDAALAGLSGPSMTSVTFVDGQQTVTVSFDANLKAGLPMTTDAWSVTDDGNPVTVSSVAYGSSPNQVVLTCSTALSGVITASLGKGQDCAGVAPAGEDITLSGQPTLNLPCMPFYDVTATSVLGVNSTECLSQCSQPNVTVHVGFGVNSVECLAQCSQPNVTIVGAVESSVWTIAFLGNEQTSAELAATEATGALVVTITTLGT